MANTRNVLRIVLRVLAWLALGALYVWCLILAAAFI